jgi:hypothetical protein
MHKLSKLHLCCVCVRVCVCACVRCVCVCVCAHVLCVHVCVCVHQHGPSKDTDKWRHTHGHTHRQDARFVREDAYPPPPPTPPPLSQTSLPPSLSRIPAVVTAVIASFNTRELSGKDAYLARNQPWRDKNLKSQKKNLAVSTRPRTVRASIFYKKNLIKKLKRKRIGRLLTRKHCGVY